MAEPVSTGTATTLAVAGVSLASVLPPTTIGVVYGAVAGTIFLLVLSPQYSIKQKFGLAIAAFMTGIISADAVASILNESTPDSVTPGSPLGAMVASFLSVRGLSLVNDLLNKRLNINKPENQPEQSDAGRNQDE